MTLEQYWTILIEHWKLVAICFLLVGMGAFVGSKLMKPLYQSSALVQVVIRSGNNTQVDYNNLLASDELVQTEATLATSDPVLREVASHYQGLTVSQLTGRVSSSIKTSTQLFEIDVVDPSPTRAALIANDIATTLIEQQLLKIQQDNTQAQQEIQQNIALTGQQIDDTQAKISALQAQGGNQGEVALLQVQLSGLQQRYNQWQAALAQLELTQAQSGNPLQVAQPAQPASSAVRPNILLNTSGGLLVGLLLGVVLAILFERLDTRVRTPEALTQLLGWPVLATIWRVRSNEEIMNPQGNNSNLEAFRILRTNIGFSMIDKPVHTLVVTSATPREGKSVVAASLAIFMARAGKNTLLIDADLRHPVQGGLFDIPGDRMGLSNAILAFSSSANTNASANHKFRTPATSVAPSSMPPVSQGSLDPFIYDVHIPNLCVMPTGPLPPDPSELLDSKAMQHLFKALGSCGAEVVIFDASPLLGLSDASILASKVNGTIVVVDITGARRGCLKRAKALLANTGTRVLGCVVNKQRRRHKDTIYSHYYDTDERVEGEALDVERAGSLSTQSVGPDGTKELGATFQEA
jgi:non-specific protein-tyrosine kinase